MRGVGMGGGEGGVIWYDVVMEGRGGRHLFMRDVGGLYQS